MAPPFHLAFPVRDLEASRKFYGELLGCSEGRSSDHWIDFDMFGHQVVAHLKPSSETEKTASQPGRWPRRTGPAFRCRVGMGPMAVTGRAASSSRHVVCHRTVRTLRRRSRRTSDDVFPRSVRQRPGVQSVQGSVTVVCDVGKRRRRSSILIRSCRRFHQPAARRLLKSGVADCDSRVPQTCDGDRL